MNTRDPFRLRQSSTPFDFLKGGADFATKAVTELQEKVEEYSNRFLDPDAGSVTSHSSFSGMSNAVSRHNRTVNQDASDSWPPPSRSPPAVDGGVGEKLHDMFKSKDELPMYKDKPYNYTPSARKLPLWRRQRLLISLLGTFALAVYWFGIRSSSGSLSQVGRGLRSYTGPSDTWEERRGQVRVAFQQSWKAYEDNAWGISPK